MASGFWTCEPMPRKPQPQQPDTATMQVIATGRILTAQGARKSRATLDAAVNQRIEIADEDNPIHCRDAKQCRQADRPLIR